MKHYANFSIIYHILSKKLNNMENYKTTLPTEKMRVMKKKPLQEGLC